MSGTDRRDIVIVAAVSALLAIPFVLARWCIGQDLPAHIETAAQLLAILRGDPATTSLYELHAPPWPNSLPTVAIAVLLALVGGVVAGKVVTVVGLVAWPTALAVLASTVRRPPLLALLAIPTAFDLSFSFGFTHFVVGKPLFALCIAAAIKLARAPSSRRALAFTTLLVVLLHCHLLLFAAALGLSVVAGVIVATEQRARIVVVVSGVTAAVPAVWWWFHKPHIPGRSTFLSPSKRLAAFWADLGDLADGAADGIPWCIAAIVVVALLGMSLRERARWRTREQLVVGVVVAACFGFWLFGPVRTAEASIIAERFLAPAIAFVPLLVVIDLGPRLRTLLITVGVVVAGTMAIEATQRWRAFSTQQMGDFDALLADIPAGASVATQLTRPLSPHGRHNALWHWPKLVALRGGHTDDAFAYRATCVVGVRAGQTPPQHPTLTAPALSSWDYLLVQSPRPLPSLARLPLTLVRATGEWQLYRVGGER
ncbi:MAG TPA: hypothetical protein VGF99_10830 [Myxococcota bacterium]